METFNLSAKVRTVVGKAVETLRAADQIPAIIYGHKVENKNLVVAANEFKKIFTAAGESSLIDLSIEGTAPVKVLVTDVQYSPVRHQLAHIDFYQVRMDEEIHATIPLVFVGEAPAVKELGGTLITSMTELEVKCLPGDLVKEIAVDLSNLKTFEDQIAVEDLTIPGKMEILAEPKAVIATVAEPHEEEVIEAAPEAAVAPEVIGEKKEEAEATPEKKVEKK